MKILTKQVDGDPAGYVVGKATISVSETSFPTDPQAVWGNAASAERKTVRIVNRSSASVTAKVEKRLDGVFEEFLLSGKYKTASDSATGGTLLGSAPTANPPSFVESEDSFFYDTTLEKWFEHDAENVAMPSDPVELTAIGIILSRSSLFITEGGSGSYTVRLSEEPAANVTITILGQAGSDVTVDTDPDTVGNDDTIVFTPTNWNVPRTVIVAAAQDVDQVHDEVTLTHSRSDGVPLPEGDNTELRVGEIILSRTSLAAAEGGTPITYNVRLASEPAAGRTLNITGFTGTDVSLNIGSLLFTSVDWNTPRDVVVTVGQDSDKIGEQVTLIHTLEDQDETADLVVNIADNDLTADLSVVVVDDDDFTEVLTANVNGIIGGAWLGRFTNDNAASKYFRTNTYAEDTIYIFYDTTREELRYADERAVPESGLVLENKDGDIEVAIAANDELIYNSVLPYKFLDIYLKVASGDHDVEIIIAGRA